jgi:hypothetical protein
MKTTDSAALRYWKSNPIIPIDRVALDNLGCEEARMRRDDLMKPDLVSEVVLLSSGTLVLLFLILAVVAALTRIALLP